jgi:hypothetical protein
VPQTVPFGSFVVVATHVWVPVAQDVRAVWQGSESVHASPALQALHAPPLQTWSVPHVVPFALGAPSTQGSAALRHEVTPR